MVGRALGRQASKRAASIELALFRFRVPSESCRGSIEIQSAVPLLRLVCHSNLSEPHPELQISFRVASRRPKSAEMTNLKWLGASQLRHTIMFSSKMKRRHFWLGSAESRAPTGRNGGAHLVTEK